MGRHRAILLTVAAFTMAGCGGTSNKLLLAGPLGELPDRNPIPEPAPVAPNQYYDFADRTFFRTVHAWFDLPRHARWIAGKPKQAIDVDAYDEVPNSAWFTNRGERLTLQEALRGPDLYDGPDTTALWRVRGVKTQGVTPGFRIKDARGDTYLLKFDPLTNPEMASAAEIIGTKLAWGFGYNTPENYLVFFTPDRLAIEGDVTITTEFGEKRTLTRDDVEKILERVPRAPDGTIRAIASKFLPGKPMGPYSYLGTREDDPNDRFRHEHRRELRGLYVFASWINHNDVRRINSLDMYDPGGFMKHYLIDFGSTLGSASVGPNLPSEGFEYQVDMLEMAKSIGGLGLRKQPWKRVELESSPEIGYFGAEGFDPGRWKPNYPNMAFARRTARDGFWGAKQVMSFTDEKIRGIVAEAKYSDPDVERFMAETLIQRRDAIGRYWCGRLCPLDVFRMHQMGADGQRVTWTDRAVAWGFEDGPATECQVELFHNDFGGRDEPIGDAVVVPGDGGGGGAAGSGGDAARVPGEAGVLVTAEQCAEADRIYRRKHRTDRDRLFYLKIRVRRGNGEWGDAVKAHLLWVGPEAGFDLAGVERE